MAPGAISAPRPKPRRRVRPGRLRPLASQARRPYVVTDYQWSTRCWRWRTCAPTTTSSTSARATAESDRGGAQPWRRGLGVEIDPARIREASKMPAPPASPIASSSAARICSRLARRCRPRHTLSHCRMNLRLLRASSPRCGGDPNRQPRFRHGDGAPTSASGSARRRFIVGRPPESPGAGG